MVKIDSSINLLNLIKDVSKNWLNDVSITKMKNKNEQSFRKEVKIQAIKAAKEKAIYLLAAIDEAIGRVISVEEINEVNNYSYNYASNNYLSNSVNTSSTASSNDGGVNNTNLIKLRYEVKVIFEIK